MEEYSKRLDLREKWIFSISFGDFEEIGQVLSIEETIDGNYFIGVYVSDVIYFVKVNSNIDIEVRNKIEFIIFFNKEVIYMLLEKLSMDFCSIKLEVDRFILFIFLIVIKFGEIIKVEFKRCIINFKIKFIFKEVVDILMDFDVVVDYLKSCIIVLFYMSRVWRRQRLGNASLYQEVDIIY